MDSLLGLRFIGAIFAAAFVATLAGMVVQPTPRLASRVRPYTASSRSALGRLPDADVLFNEQSAVDRYRAIPRAFRPMVESITTSIAKVVGALFDDGTLAFKLRQAGVLTEIPEADRVQEYRVRQVGAGLGFGLLAGFAGVLVGAAPAISLLLFLLGVLLGVSRRSAGVSSRIQERRERMRVELYTINQLLAIYLRTSGSPVLAAQRLVRRGRGAVIEELDEALRLHARGMPASKAFNRIAEQTAEPFAARTYKLLASGSERGADLADALLSLSEDVREFRRTSVRRSATKRQATVLLPIILLLAPVMLLFIAAPLPSILFSTTR